MKCLQNRMIIAASLIAFVLSNRANAFDDLIPPPDRKVKEFTIYNAVGTVVDSSLQIPPALRRADLYRHHNPYMPDPREDRSIELYKGFCRLKFLNDWTRIEATEYEKQTVQNIEEFLKFSPDKWFEASKNNTPELDHPPQQLIDPSSHEGSSNRIKAINTVQYNPLAETNYAFSVR